MLRICRESQSSPSKGSAPIRANRHAYAACTAARKLCKVAFDKHADENAPLLVVEIDNLEGHLNNHLHNLML
eukprot:scaffold259046_cov33-Tisochrysis_lutea.AAC.4